jgi:hypothetical protein
MDLTAKLQIKPGQQVAVIAAPGDAPPIGGSDPAVSPAGADAVIAFTRSREELATVAAPAIEAARGDRLAWIAYPKAGKLGTDLNRDTLAAALSGHAIAPVRQVAIDETWSALRFRPA